MGKEYYKKEFTCFDCFYGCKGHKWEFKGHTTSMCVELFLDEEKIGIFSYECIKNLKSLLNEVEF